MITMAGILQRARSQTDDTDARVGVSLKLSAFDALINFSSAFEKIDMRRPTPATIATSAT